MDTGGQTNGRPDTINGHGNKHPWNTRYHDNGQNNALFGPPGTTDEHEHGRHDKGPENGQNRHNPTTNNQLQRIAYLCKNTLSMHELRKPTKRETAALFALVAGIVDNWADCYIIAYDGKNETVINQKSLAVSVSRWKNSGPIALEYERLKTIFEQTKRKAIEDYCKETDGGTADNIGTKSGKKGLIDYSDPANQATKLNELVNTATDGGEALDALKVIIQSQRADREAAKDGKVVRAYLPISCVACPLYKLQVKKHGKEL